MNLLDYLRKQSIFKDRTALWLIILGFGLVLAGLLYMAININQRDFKVPVRYSSYYKIGVTNRGEWYTLYVLPIFAAVTFAVNMVLATRIHGLQRGLALALLSLTLVILVFSLLVIRALLGLN